MLLWLFQLVFTMWSSPMKRNRSCFVFLLVSLALSNGGVSAGTANILSEADRLNLLQQHNDLRASQGATNMILLVRICQLL